MREKQLTQWNVWGWLLVMLMSACLQDFEQFRPGEGGTDASGGTSSQNGGSTSTTQMEGGAGGESTHSSGGSGGDPRVGGSGGSGGSDPCDEDEKLCGEDCVDVDNPDYGCSVSDGDCVPCSFDHADATCSDAECALGACDEDFENCDDEPENGCEASLRTDVDSCGGCDSLCGSITDASCLNAVCIGPCGPVPSTGLLVCWEYGSSNVPVSQHVGLAGGAADPDEGETIDEVFLDPWCVNPIPGVRYVQCSLGSAEPNWDIQFRASLHESPAEGTIAGTWDCSPSSCEGSFYLYFNGEEIGSVVNDVETGVASTIPHFNPPGLLNGKVVVP